MKTALYAIVALSLGLSAALPASAAFGPKDLPTIEGPAFGPADITPPNGPAFGPADIEGAQGPAFGPADIRGVEGPANIFEPANQR